jgi:molybdenum cofactor cytidylyltransferase
VAFVGAGGKTTAMFSLARQLDPPVIVSATTHMGSWELRHADTIYILDSNALPASLESIKPEHGVTLLVGPLVETDRHAGLTGKMVDNIHSFVERRHLPFLVEADGSRMRSLKAPASHEPPIPEFVDQVVVVAGMSAVGQILSDKIVHRVESFSDLSGILPGDVISPEVVVKVLCHRSGGLKNIPNNAKKTLLLNQADTALQQNTAREIAILALSCYESVIVASLGAEKIFDDGKENTSHIDPIYRTQVISVYEHIAGIILAAGEARRFGRPKQIIDWYGEPLIRRIARIAVDSGLSEVIVVLGANAEQILPVLADLKVSTVLNAGWHEGQSSSVRAGIQSLGEHINAAIFILADQPFISAELIHALIAEHIVTLAPIIAPSVNGRRGNPILFDRVTFPDLMTLTGDEGGRAIINRFSACYINWHDPSILMDIDTTEDYLRLKDSRNDEK